MVAASTGAKTGRVFSFPYCGCEASAIGKWLAYSAPAGRQAANPSNGSPSEGEKRDSKGGAIFRAQATSTNTLRGRRGLATLLRSQRLGLGRGGSWRVYSPFPAYPGRDCVPRFRPGGGVYNMARYNVRRWGMFLRPELGWSRLLGAVTLHVVSVSSKLGPVGAEGPFRTSYNPNRPSTIRKGLRLNRGHHSGGRTLERGTLPIRGKIIGKKKKSQGDTGWGVLYLEGCCWDSLLFIVGCS